MTLRIPGSFAALALATCVAVGGVVGCGGGDRAQKTASTQEPAAPEPPAGKAQHVTVSYYYLPG
jgi:hypothetical protein